MAVQWLGCCVSNVGDKGLIHGQGIKTSHAVLCSQKIFLIKKKRASPLLCSSPALRAVTSDVADSF